jgi:hypothetical protein
LEVTVDEQAGIPDAGANGCRLVLVSKKVGVIAIKLSVTDTVPEGIPFPAVTSVPTASEKLSLLTLAGVTQVAVALKFALQTLAATAVGDVLVPPTTSGVTVIPAAAGVTVSEPPALVVTGLIAIVMV